MNQRCLEFWVDIWLDSPLNFSLFSDFTFELILHNFPELWRLKQLPALQFKYFVETFNPHYRFEMFHKRQIPIYWIYITIWARSMTICFTKEQRQIFVMGDHPLEHWLPSTYPQNVKIFADTKFISPHNSKLLPQKI